MPLFLVREGEPLVFDEDGIDTFAGERLSVERIRVNAQMLSKAAEYDRTFDPITQAVWTKHELNDVITAYEKVVDDVKSNCGKLIVRYVGDLKATEYPMTAKLFHLAETVSQDEMTSLIALAMNSGQAEVDFINLRNVRDIKVKVGHRAVVGIEDELRYADTVVQALTAWMSAQCGARLKDG